MTENVINMEHNLIGVIDVGSNSIRFVVYDNSQRWPNYFYNEKIMLGLGSELTETGKLHPKGRIRALKALERFGEIAKSMNLNRLVAIATEAVRIALDGKDFCESVYEITGIQLKIITGAEEAKLSAQGILLGWPQASGLVCDIGGASLELAQLEAGKITIHRSSKLGPMAVLGRLFDPILKQNHINSEIGKLFAGFKLENNNLFLVGGSWRALAKLDMKRKEYPLQIVHGYIVSPEDISSTLKFAVSKKIKEFPEDVNINKFRVKLLPTAAEILIEFLKNIKVKKIIFSGYGIREGILYENLSNEIREQNTLINDARLLELNQSRFPGFGDKLYKWVSPLFSNLDNNSKRLVHVICLLHDVHWRIHSDHRSNFCFESTLLSNLGGLSHEERIFLATCFLHRYKIKSILADRVKINELLNNKQISLAQTIGSAVRLGAMINGSDLEKMGHLSVTSESIILELNVSGKKIFGEVALKRLQSVANSMKLKASINYV